MEGKYTKPLLVAPSMSDGSGLLSLPSTFSCFMDLAMEHAMKLGIGLDYTMPRGLFWITVRTRVHFNRRPHLSDMLEANTWPEPAGRLRCVRYYALSDGKGIAVEGKTEWAIIEMATGKPQRLDDIYPEDIEFCTDRVSEAPFVRIDEDFENGIELGSFCVGSADIDMGHHMNNVMYIRELVNLFSVKELEEMCVEELEVCYRASCYEGEELKVVARLTPDGADLAIVKPEGKTAILAHLVCKNTDPITKRR